MKQVTMYKTEHGSVWYTPEEAHEAEAMEGLMAILETMEGIFWNDTNTADVAKLIHGKGYMLIPRKAE
jgi:hypothetical protein